MTPDLDKVRERVERIETTPTIPAVILPLLESLRAPAENANLLELARLISFDSTIAAQTLRMASSPLFGLAQPPKSISSAVMSLGMRRIETIVLTCCLGRAFPPMRWALDPATFWRHSLGCAMVCRKFSEKLAGSEADKAYTAGLLHDLGFVANMLAFPQEFANAMRVALQQEIPLGEAEEAVMGFTHCLTGRILAEKWKLTDDLVQVIAHHHAVGEDSTEDPMIALVHLGDQLCRMRNLGYGYYERHKIDMVYDPAWSTLSKYHNLSQVDLARFTFEFDEDLKEIELVVASVFGAGSARN